MPESAGQRTVRWAVALRAYLEARASLIEASATYVMRRSK